jgi:hypothetical protein
VYAAMASREKGAGGEAAILAHWLKIFDEMIAPPAVRPESLMPRLVTAARLAQITAQAPLPSRALDGTGLHVVYVIDGRETVRYVFDQDAAALNLDEGALFDTACANLEARAPGAVARAVATCFERPALAVIKTLDSYDAARLLLVRATIPPGRRLVALVPDRDTLALTMDPGDEGGWQKLRELARVPHNQDHLLVDRPLSVRAEGLTLD